MEITKRGIPANEKKYYGKCVYCDTEAVAEAHELTLKSSYRRGSFLTARCPICNSTDTMIFHEQKENNGNQD